jgi:hypothetical protein
MPRLDVVDMGTPCMGASPLNDRISDVFAGIEPVESVYGLISGNSFTVFTVIDVDDEDTYDLIYERERLLIHEFSGVHFDFNVIARRGRPLDSVVGSCSPIWQRSGSPDLCLNVTNT